MLKNVGNIHIIIIVVIVCIVGCTAQPLVDLKADGRCVHLEPEGMVSVEVLVTLTESQDNFQICIFKDAEAVITCGEGSDTSAKEHIPRDSHVTGAVVEDGGDIA